MFVWGGNAGSVGQHHSRLDMFGVNMLTEEWHQHDVTPPDTPPPCERSCSAAIGNTIYSYGGVISFQPFRTSDELYKLNLDVMRWRRVTTRDTKPEGRCGAGMCSMNGRLLLMGGHGPLPSQMKHPRAEYKKGGLGEGCGWNNELFEFDPKTGECVSEQGYSYLFKYLFIYLYIYLLIYLFIYFEIFMSLLITYLFIQLLINISAYLFIHLFTYLQFVCKDLCSFRLCGLLGLCWFLYFI